jgi:hypothetical protein
MRGYFERLNLDRARESELCFERRPPLLIANVGVITRILRLE